ncbi:MAG: hypothetical protein AMJ81_08930, partial [Phycisphaerae bacterium SM23_33]
AGSVRCLARRRRSARMAAAAVATVLAGAGAALWLSAPGGGPGPLDRTALREEPANLRAEIERLRAEADSRTAVVKHMLAMEGRQIQLARLQLELARPDPEVQVRQEVEKAAWTTVCDADRMYEQPGARETAVAAFRRVIQLFPDTPGAIVARMRLSKINTREGEML